MYMSLLVGLPTVTREVSKNNWPITNEDPGICDEISPFIKSSMKVSEISTDLRCSFSKCAQPSRTQRNIRSFLLTSVRFSSLLSPVLAQFSVFVDPFTSLSLICVFALTWRWSQEKVNTSIPKQKLLSIVNMFINAGRRYRRSLVGGVSHQGLISCLFSCFLLRLLLLDVP